MNSKIILASNSIYRKSVLSDLQIPFCVLPSDADESIDNIENLEDVPLILAQRKACATAKMLSGFSGNSNLTEKQNTEQAEKIKEALNCDLILAADTVLLFENRIIGKQPTVEHARNCLQNLSGKSHKVISALALLNRKNGKLTCKKNTTVVTFKSLKQKEIDSYLQTGEWQGAAGAYRIQKKGAFFTEKIEGSFTSVAGLPISELYDMLSVQGYPVWN